MSVTVCLDPIWQASQLRIREQLPPTFEIECCLVFGGCSWIVSGMERMYSRETEDDKFVSRVGRRRF